ncbi:MoaF-related domain-containing protein [Kitasatospora sp. NPDC090091]|uniref:MoaF-related domain-containing protein n=1 Tax=Kitasatospora sp. NPDC090091 TaxID=3364081 RepID=UPI0037FCEF57
MKRKFVAVAAAAALSLTGTATLVASQASATEHPGAGSQLRPGHLPPFAGHAYLVTVADTGAVYRNTFSADGKSVTGLTVKGSNPGRTFTAPDLAVQTGPRQYFISWIEPGDVTVSQVADFEKHTVEFYVTSTDSAGTRSGAVYHATLTQVS